VNWLDFAFFRSIHNRMVLIWKWIGENEKQIKILFTLIGALYVIWEYRSSLKQTRILAAMDFVEQYSKPPVYDDKKKLALFWMSDKGINFVNEQKKLTSKERKEAYSKNLLVLLKNNSANNNEQLINELAIDGVFNFYKDVSYCLKTNKCDRDTICQYFFSAIKGFEHTYRPVLEKLSTDYGNSSGEVLSEFVRECSD
jgi:hypothetical protein